MFKEFVIECKRNPFFWWSVAMWGLLTLSAFSIFNHILQWVVIYRLYIIILFVAVALFIIITITPLTQGLKKFFKEISKIKALFFVATIFMSIYTDAFYFVSEPVIIFTKLDSSTIRDQNALDYIISTKTLIQFLALPFFQTIMITLTKRELEKHECQTYVS
ncbi:MAG: hypothetical protein AB1299_08675, partial [Thermoproteota archaeon]